MDVSSPSNQSVSVPQVNVAESLPYRGFLSWLFPTSQPATHKLPELHLQRVVTNPTPSNSLEHAVANCWRNLEAKEAARCWEQIEVDNRVNLTAGCPEVVQSFYTDFRKQIYPASSLTVAELNTEIYMASYYGARDFNAMLWFSAAGNSGIGLVCAKNDSSCYTHFYAFQEMPDGIVPILIPSHSRSGIEGRLCIYESNIGEVGVSTWNINTPIPKRLFHQTGFDDICFLENKYVLGFRRSNATLECWNIETHALEYSLAGWCQPNPTFLGYGPFNAEKQILLAHADQYLYAFDLQEKQFAYFLDLSTLGGNGTYHNLLVGDDLLCCRASSTAKVHVFDIASGKPLYDFDIGGASDYKDVDDFPMCILNQTIAALKAGDRKTIQLRQGENGAILKTFGPTPQDITGIYFAEGRLIAACQWNTEKRVDNFHDQIIIWDLDSGEQLTSITAPDGYDMSVQDITAGKLTTYLQKFSDEADAKLAPPQTRKNLKLRKPLEMHKAKGIHWTNPDQLQLLSSSIRLEVWDAYSCTHLGSIQETFTSTEGLPLFATFNAGKFVLDSDLSVLVQYFH